MAKLPILFTLICFSTLVANSKGLSQASKTINPKPIRVYQIVVIEGGPHPTTYEVARSSISTNATSFGIVYVKDDIFTAGPDPNSQQLGRVQGTAITTGLKEPSVTDNYNFIFNTGKYEGSSLRVAGQRLLFVPNQEIPIAGGTGAFRGAQGYVITSFISFDPTTNTFIFEYLFYLSGISFLG